MDTSLGLYVGLMWLAVFIYILATVANVAGVVFDRGNSERVAYRLAVAALVLHGGVIVYWWRIVGHGPYMAPSEVLSSDAWIVMALFLVFQRIYPQVRPASIIAFPATFLLLALGLFYNPGIRTLPATFRSVWLVFHILFYKIALSTIVIAFAFSLFYLLKRRRDRPWMRRLPDLSGLDLYAYRFAGFGFIFWAIGMLAGSVWAYQSWGRFWGWDPVETWALLTWIVFGIYLHLRRFYRWGGERAAWLFMVCFVISLLSLFYTSHMSTSIHAEYFK